MPSKKVINLATTDETTFFHELAHAVDHHLRGDKMSPEHIEDGYEGTKRQQKNEAIAELTSAVLARMYGIEVVNRSGNYLKQYTENRKDSEVGPLCMGVMNEVGKILDFIFQEGSE